MSRAFKCDLCLQCVEDRAAARLTLEGSGAHRELCWPCVGAIEQLVVKIREANTEAEIERENATDRAWSEWARSTDPTNAANMDARYIDAVERARQGQA